MAPLESYEMLEPSERDESGQQYRALRITKKVDDNLSNITFRVGDVVYVDGSEEWVAHLVELYDSRPPAADDIQVVHDSQAHNHYKATLRWFYRWNDLNPHSRREWETKFPNHIKGEMYFSDNIEPTGNKVDCLLGIAKLVQSPEELSRARIRGERARIVRCFYGFHNGNPPPIRELLPGELRSLLENPSTDDLFRTERRMLGGRFRPVAKGLRHERYSPSSGISTVNGNVEKERAVYGECQQKTSSSVSSLQSDEDGTMPKVSTQPGQLFIERNHTARKTAKEAETEEEDVCSSKFLELKPQRTLRKKQTVRKSAVIRIPRTVGKVPLTARR